MKRIVTLVFFAICSLIQQTAYAQPPGNRGLYFDGVNDYVTIPTEINTNFYGSSDFTVETWVKIATLPTTNMALFNKSQSTTNSFGISIGILNDGKLSFATDNLLASGWHYTTTTASVVNVNRWVHVSFVYNNGTKTIYVNGMAATVTSSGTSSVGATVRPNTPWLIGYGTLIATDFFKGQMDEIRIYTDVRTPGQITADMTSTAANSALCYWDFENDVNAGNQTFVTNKGSLGTTSNGTLTNGPLWALRVSNTNDLTSQGSLRWAITEANTDTDKDYIDFSIQQASTATVSTISQTSSLPIISEAVILDGYSAYGSNVNTNTFQAGSNAQIRTILSGTGLFSLNITSTGSIIRGLSITGGATGIELAGSSNQLAGCFIGILPNGTLGTFVNSSSKFGGTSNLIGTQASPSNFADINVFASGNSNNIIFNGSTNTTFRYNYVSTNATGNSKTYSGESILLENTNSGVLIENNIITGTTGILFNSTNTGISSNTLIQNNSFGLGANGTTALSMTSGIVIGATSTNTTIRSNTITNATNGVVVWSAYQGITISKNNIYCNGFKGINLNSTGNNDKAKPVITSANFTTISGTCTAGDVVEIFKDNPACGGSDQGRQYLGNATVTGTNWTYTGTFALNDRITATATDATNGTSEFSVAMLVAAPLPGAALDFAGAQSVSLTKHVLSDFTIEFWLKTTQAGVNQPWYYSTSLIDADNLTFGTGDYGVYLGNGTITLGVGVTEIDGTKIVNDGVWHHVAITRNSSTGLATIYIDGLLDLSKVLAAGTLSNGNPIRLGANMNGFTYVGQLDEIRIWNKILTTCEINNNMNCENPSNQTGLAAHYSFNQGVASGSNATITTLTDISGNNLNGTLNGFALTGATSNWVAPGGVVSGTACTPVAFVTPTISIATTATTICTGTAVTFTATTTNGGSSPSYKWRKNGTDITGATNATYTSSTIAQADLVSCELTSNASCASTNTVTSTGILMTVNSTLTPSISITATANTICTGTAVTFTATIINGGSSPSYQWKKNGTDITGATNLTYTSSTLVNADVISCTLTSNALCASTTNVTSTGIAITVNPTLTPTIAITSTATAICTGTAVTFNATVINGGSSPSYQWKKNGTDITGATNATFSSATLANTDVVSCTLTSNASCASTTTVTSTGILMTVNPILTPSISITATATTICAGTTVTFTATATNGGATPAYQWKKNGTDITGATNATYTSLTLVNTDVISCALTSNALCAAPTNVTSTGITITVNSTLTPTIAITATATSICAGTAVTFTATATNGGTTPSYQWKKNGADITGATNSTHTSSTLANTDVISCTLTSNALCAATTNVTSTGIAMTVTPLITPTVSITSTAASICVGGSVIFTATPTTGGASPTYQWKNNGTDITGATNALYSTSSLVAGNSISVEMISNASCANTAPILSVPVSVTINSLPTVTTSQTSSICSGSTTAIALTSSPSGASFNWSANLANGTVNGFANGNTGSITQTLTGEGVVNYSVIPSLGAGCVGTATTIAVTVYKPVISPSSLPRGKFNNTYNQAIPFTVNNSTTAVFSLSPTSAALPIGMSFTTNKLTGVPTQVGSFPIRIRSTDAACITDTTLLLTIQDLSDPSLKFTDRVASKFRFDADFTLPISSNSTAGITYTSNSSDVTINSTSGLIKIHAVNETGIWIKATQIANQNFKAAKDSILLYVFRQPTTTSLTSLTGLIKNVDAQITLDLDPARTVSYSESSNTSIAQVSTTGTITPIGLGNFAVEVSIAETPDYAALDTFFIFTVFDGNQAPIAKSDTITVIRNLDYTFNTGTINLLSNDQGVTGQIKIKLTDIDSRNVGYQNLFYSPAIGNFQLDTLTGVLTIYPFKGMSGNSKIGYTITDENGYTSPIAYLVIGIQETQAIPDLKANEVMTPNGDGANDALVIGYTDVSAKNHIVITDEASNIVYQTDNYQNDWTGLDSNGNKLEAGVYYFIFSEKEGNERLLRAFIQIVQ